MTGDRRFLKTALDIFGYSFVGALAYCFGLFLQNYNSKGSFYANITDGSLNTHHIIICVIIQFLLILLFGHAYAYVILFKPGTEENIEVFDIIGHWIETVFICVISFLVLCQIMWPQLLSINFWCTIVANILIYALSFVAYRSLKSEKGEFKRGAARYTLVCPALLMIGVNIYSGADILSLLTGNIISFIPMGLFFFALLLLYVCKGGMLKWVYMVFTVLCIGAGVASINTGLSSDGQLTMKNLFLAVMASIFLSIFESWYVAFRQMQNSSKELFTKVSAFIVTLMPPLVFFLYPIQDFNFIYYFTVCIGMFIADYVSFLKVFPIIMKEGSIDERGKRNIAILRAICGIATLVFLIADKYIVFNPSWNEIRENSNVLDILSLIVSVICLIFSYFGISKAQGGKLTLGEFIKKASKDTNGNLKMASYIIIRMIVFVFAAATYTFLSGFLNGDISKSKLSSLGIFIFTIETFALYVFIKREPAEETKGKERSDENA